MKTVGNRFVTKTRKLTLLSALYVAQGLPYGFFTMALPVLLRKANLSLPQIGLTSLLTLPWALKFIWAPAVDRWHFAQLGLRRSWLLPVQVASVVLYAALAALALDPGRLSLILVAFLFSNVLAASQDIATDALAVDVMQPSERGWANGIKVAGYRAGMIVGGWVLLSFYPELGWTGLMLAMALIAALCTVPVALYREPREPREHVKPVRSRPLLVETIQFFLKPGALKWTGALLVYKFGHAAASSMIRLWLVDQAYELTDIGWILGSGSFVAGFLGAVTGGWVATRGSRAKLLVGLGGLQVIGVLSYLWPVLTSHSTAKVFAAASLDNFTSGLATTVLFTLMMDACSRDRAASDYSAQACTVVVSQTVAGVFAGFAAQAWGYPIFFAVSSAIGAASLGATWFVLRSRDVRGLLEPLKGGAGAD